MTPHRLHRPTSLPLAASLATLVSLAVAPLAHGAEKPFKIPISENSYIAGPMDIQGTGEPTILTVNLVDVSTTSPTYYPLIADGFASEASITTTRIYRGGLAFVIEPLSPIAEALGVVDSFAIMQWQDTPQLFHALQWTPVDVPLIYLQECDATCLCMLLPDDQDPYQNIVPIPGELQLIVVEYWDSNPPTLEGFVFMPGVDGCWSMEFAPIICNPPYLPIDPVLIPMF